ncbi:recombinase RecT [Treponema denticola]|uniref:recombinase RecT n=1 Tax=Treponema denticola TaxID=158 RepID=UPI003D8D0834
MNELTTVKKEVAMSFDDQMRMAEVMAKSGLLPKALDTKEKVFIALQWGVELGLTPMAAATNIAVINGKPTLSADIMHAIVRNNPEYAGAEWKKQDEQAAEVLVKRKNANMTETFRGYYDIEMAKRANLLSKENWRAYPARMLKHRALSFALRDAFPDVLAGLYSPDDLSGDNQPAQNQKQGNYQSYEMAEKTEPEQEATLEPLGAEPCTNPAPEKEKSPEDFYREGTAGLLATAAKLGEILPESIHNHYAKKINELKLIKNPEKRFFDTKELVELLQKEVEHLEADKQPQSEIF